MRHTISITLVILTGLCALRIGVAYPLDQDPASSSKTTVELPDVSEAERLSTQVVELYQAGRLDEAMPLAKRVLKLREKALGNSHYLVGDAVSNLALLYLAAEKYGDAEDHFRRALKIYEKETDKNAVLIAKTLERLAHLQSLKRKFDEAEKLYLRVISIKEQSLGPNHAEFLASLNGLADLFLRQRDYKRAEPALQRAAATTGIQLGEASREFGRALERLACAQHRNNQPALAEQTDARANRILYSEAAKKAEPVTLENQAFECRLTSELRPDFTNAARAGGFRGATKVVIAVEVDELGAVTVARMVGGDPIFQNAAEKAVLAARFRPMSVDGKPVKIRGTIVRDYAVMTMTRTVVVPVTTGRP